MSEPNICAHCGRKIRMGTTAAGRRIALDIEHPVFTPVPVRQRDGSVIEELVRTQLSIAWHQCPKRGEQ